MLAVFTKTPVSNHGRCVLLDRRVHGRVVCHYSLFCSYRVTPNTYILNIYVCVALLAHVILALGCTMITALSIVLGGALVVAIFLVI